MHHQKQSAPPEAECTTRGRMHHQRQSAPREVGCTTETENAPPVGECITWSRVHRLGQKVHHLEQSAPPLEDKDQYHGIRTLRPTRERNPRDPFRFGCVSLRWRL